MKKFTKLVLENENQRYYEVSCELKLLIKSDSEGEAGYMSDSILGSIEEQVDFKIENISEITKDEYQQYFENVSEESEEDVNAMNLYMGKYALHSETEYTDTDEEKILKTWEALFGNRTPNPSEKMEFYHRMRAAGIDGTLVFKVLKGKI